MSLYATFRLGGLQFGLDLMQVREINRILDITPVPHARAHIRGLINLRGQIVTIIDLRVRLGLERQDLPGTGHNIILKPGPHRDGRAAGELAGLLVDAIGDVVEADPAAVEPPAANVCETEARFLAGVLNTGSGLVVLLDLNEVLQGE